MSDLFDTYMHMENGRNIRASQFQVGIMQAIQELEQRVTYLEKKYGVELPNYYEYKQENPVSKAKDNTGTIALCVGGGGIAGALLSNSKITGVAIGVASGALIGSMFGDHQEILNAKHIEKYEKFLDKVEIDLKQQKITRDQASNPQTVAHNLIPQGMVTNPITIDEKAL